MCPKCQQVCEGEEGEARRMWQFYQYIMGINSLNGWLSMEHYSYACIIYNEALKFEKFKCKASFKILYYANTLLEQVIYVNLM